MSDPVSDLASLLDTLEVGVALEDIAALCARAEAGDGEEAAKKLLEALGHGKVTESIAQYSRLKEQDIVSFYAKRVAVLISGEWGGFWLVPGLDAIPPNTTLPAITPIGLYALACAVKDALKEPNQENF
jgi:hypothetical protein